jgi:CDP-diacylglycerol--glycerol-3-phosphate 3-phosphatidyltransferase
MSERLSNLVRRLARHPGRALALTGVSPNAITVAGGVCNVGVAAALALGRLPPVWAGLAIVVSGFVDALDGAVAKQTGRVSEFGAFLDSVIDRVSDSIILAGLLVAALRGGRTVEVGLLALALVSFPLVPYTRAQAEKLGIECKGGWMTRTVRVLVLGASVAAGLLAPAVALLALGSFFTAGQRIAHVRRALAARARQ